METIAESEGHVNEWPHLKPADGEVGTLCESLRYIFGPQGAPSWSPWAHRCLPMTPKEIEVAPLSPEHQAIFNAIRPRIEDMVAEAVVSAVDALRGAA